VKTGAKEAHTREDSLDGWNQLAVERNDGSLVMDGGGGMTLLLGEREEKGDLLTPFLAFYSRRQDKVVRTRCRRLTESPASPARWCMKPGTRSCPGLLTCGPQVGLKLTGRCWRGGPPNSNGFLNFQTALNL
jgi:hypothetical protein